MQLTTELLKRFKGGQIEVQNQGERYLFRGEIETIVVENNRLYVNLAWFAKGEGFPPLPKKWVKSNTSSYEASLEIYPASDIGPSGPEIGGDSRISLNSDITGEIVVLYPLNGSKLDPAKVEGLVVPSPA